MFSRDRFVFLILAGHVHADRDVAALNLVVDGLAQVVEQTCALGDGDVRAQLRGNEPGDVGHFDRVLQHVLAVAGTVLHAAEQAHELGVDAVNVRLEHGALALGLDGGVDLLLGLGDHFLDAGGVDAAVGDELLQRQTGHLAADGVKAGDGDCLGGVVDDQVAAGQRLNGADVAALAADDAAFHLVVRQRHDRYGHFAGVVGGAALDRRGDDLAGHAVGLVLVLGFDLFELGGLLVRDLGFERLDQIGLGFFDGVTGNLFQHLLLGFADGADLILLCFHVGKLGVERFGLAVERVGLAVERFLLLLEAALLLLQLGAAGFLLVLELRAALLNLFLCFHERFALLALGALEGVVDDALCLFLGAGDLRLGDLLAIDHAEHKADHERGDADDDPNNRAHVCVCSSILIAFQIGVLTKGGPSSVSAE